MASIIAAKDISKQYEIVGKCEDTFRLIGSRYPIGFNDKANIAESTLWNMSLLAIYLKGEGYPESFASEYFVRDGELQAEFVLSFQEVINLGYQRLSSCYGKFDEAPGTEFDAAIQRMQDALRAATDDIKDY
jgi:hypothetical protein